MTKSTSESVPKPFSQACENNKRPILAVLTRAFSACREVLEIGSGTGQHAAFFAEHLPHLCWNCSDQPDYHNGINMWLDEAALPNLVPPVALTIGKDSLPDIAVQGVFSANTAHIMQRQEAELLMKSVSEYLPSKGVFCQYGPFTIEGEFSSQSNKAFHESLIQRGYGGYRDINELTEWGEGLVLREIHEMPANNLLLEWHKN